MSLKNELDVHGQNLRVLGNEKEGYIISWKGKIVKTTHDFEHAMDIAFAMLLGDYETLAEYGISPEAIP